MIDLGKNVKGFTEGLTIEDAAIEQLTRTASLPILAGHLAVMPDAHYGIGSTVGSVIPTRDAIIPAAVGVDIGCGMIAVRTNLKDSDLPDSLAELRRQIERSVPVGFNIHSHPFEPNANTIDPSQPIANEHFKEGMVLVDRMLKAEKAFHMLRVIKKAGQLNKASVWNQIGTLGGGNHFIEVCVSTTGEVWIMLHSGSRGIGNQIARIAIAEARELALKNDVHLPDRDLAWLDQGTPEFDEYMESLDWSQNYAALNRDVMLHLVLGQMYRMFPQMKLLDKAINSHHNYTSRERHFGEDMWITRKGAVNAAKDVYGIIPGSMGAKSFIVKGKGNADSYCSCSHGAGRAMSRTKASKMFTAEDLAEQTNGVECRKDTAVVDEIPAAYKDIDKVMLAQADLVEIVAEIKQVLCVKG